VKSRYCGTEFGTVDPLSLADIHQRGRRSDRLQSLRKSVVTLFVISLLGCPAPLTAIVALVMLLPQWALVRKAGPVYLVMAYSTIVLSVLYSVLMLLFALYGGL
jgi:Fe2+ transport system protein B